MGTDIHLFTEKKGADGKWKLFAVETECSWCENGKYGEDSGRAGETCYWCKGTARQKGYDGRNYDLFAVLGNVQNGYGFAGVKTGSGLNYISDSRGLPDDMSAELKSLAEHEEDDNDDGSTYDRFKGEYGSGWLGYHSFSYVTLKELLDFFPVGRDVQTPLLCLVHDVTPAGLVGHDHFQFIAHPGGVDVLVSVRPFGKTVDMVTGLVAEGTCSDVGE